MKSAHTKLSPFKAWLKVSSATALALGVTGLSACATVGAGDTDTPSFTPAPVAAPAPAPAFAPVNPVWPELKDAGLVDADVEAKIDALMAQMTIEEKVGQTIQGDIASIKPEDLKNIRSAPFWRAGRRRRMVMNAPRPRNGSIWPTIFGGHRWNIRPRPRSLCCSGSTRFTVTPIWSARLSFRTMSVWAPRAIRN